jgi:hypothetical protein
MSFEEDRIELMGTAFQRLKYDLKNKHLAGSYLVETSPGTWEMSYSKPPPGQGRYIIRMPKGELREYANRVDSDGSYSIVG